ncbi:MAG TPA: glycosyl hydrolase family 8 [Polyangiaceae bacterium]|jgi:endo-1,4-beta-D-glucanase Y
MRLCLTLLCGISASFSVLACSSADSGQSGTFSGNSSIPSGGSESDAAGQHSGGASSTPNIVGQGGQGGTGAGQAGGSTGVGSGGTTLSAAGTSSAPPVTWNGAKSASVTDAQLQTEYAAWKSAHVMACSNGSQAVLKDAGSAVSEGIGYGMLLSAAMNDQPVFDGLWKYYQDHLDKNGLMNWTSSPCEAPDNNNSNAATDGDLDTAMALVQAAARWPNGGYLPKAQALAGKIAQFESDMCNGRRVLKPGDAFGGCSDPNDPKLDPSYFAPGYYKVFAHYFTDQAATWTALADGSYQLYAVYQARLDNLVPDWSRPDGSDYNGSMYWYDACRTPWRVAVDYAWTGDSRAKTFMQNLSTWVDAHGGLPSAAQQQNSAFVGAFALAGGYEQAKFDGYMSGWLGATLDDTPYFQGTLRVLYLLVAAGKFSSTL